MTQMDMFDEFPSLRQAGHLISHERQDDYGSPEDNFSTIAAYWSLYLHKHITERDVCALMVLLKLSRGTLKRDNWLDTIGYSAIAADKFLPGDIG